jgi:hypothetical protein
MLHSATKEINGKVRLGLGHTVETRRNLHGMLSPGKTSVKNVKPPGQTIPIPRLET